MIIEILIMAFEAIWSNKLRTALSMLGIIIGVSTVIAVFAIGQGSQQAVNAQFQNLSADSIIVMGNQGREATASSKLDLSDAKVIMEKAEHVTSASGSITGNLAVSYGAESGNYSVIGTDENFMNISNLKISSGRPLEKNDIDSKSLVAVLGNDVASTLFPQGNPIGKEISLASKRFEVIGVLAETGSNIGRMSSDESIIIPGTTAEKSLLGNRGMTMINVRADNVDNVSLATEEITSILRSEHKLKTEQENDFRIMDAGSMVGAAQESAKTMTFLLTAIAAITLLVSGIGIMNVMFVTVAERTKEIGIAKAIGGKQSDILGQFLLESIILSAIGGVMGVIIGQAVIPLISKFSSITMASTLTGPLIGFSFSALVGVFFGFYPALKASRLDPVDALRSQ